MEDVKKIWEQNGFPSTNKLWSILQQRGLTKYYVKSEIAQYIAKQKVSQLHHRPSRPKYSHITTTAPGIMYCIDLLDMTAYARSNGGIKWLLLCIDIFTRAAVIVGAKNKTASTIAAALQDAFEQFELYPKVVLSDQGSEFKGATAKFLQKHGVIHRLAEVGDHRRLGIVDRFSGIVKGWIAKHQTYNQSPEYVSALGDLLENYNNAPHSSLGGMTPNEAWEFPSKARDFHYGRVQKGLMKRSKAGTIGEGDWVRVLKLRGVFDKGYHVKYSLTAHQVVEIKGLNYILDNGKFYRAARLLKVPAPEEEEAAPKDVAAVARRERKTERILQQEGVDPEKNSALRRSARERKPASQLEDSEYGRINY